jgi:hypothetical protein
LSVAFPRETRDDELGFLADIPTRAILAADRERLI